MAITIDRLSGGNTPADGSDPRTFPAIWNATAAILEANVGEGGGGSITVSPTPPTDPAPENGNLWWNSTEGEMYIYYVDGTSSQWVAAAGPSVTVAATAPTGYEGQLWLDSTDGSMYVYYTDPGGANAQWIGAVSRSGGILQVVSTTKTDTFSASVASSNFVTAPGMSATITPSSASSKILITCHVGALATSDQTANPTLVLNDGTSRIAVGDADGSRARVTAGGRSTGAGSGDSLVVTSPSFQFLHSPSTTSAITYFLELYNASGVTRTLYLNRQEDTTDASTRIRTISTITLMEVAG